MRPITPKQKHNRRTRISRFPTYCDRRLESACLSSVSHGEQLANDVVIDITNYIHFFFRFVRSITYYYIKEFRWYAKQTFIEIAIKPWSARHLGVFVWNCKGFYVEYLCKICSFRIRLEFIFAACSVTSITFYLPQSFGGIQLFD